MILTEDKVLVHFNTNDINVYILKNDTLKALFTEHMILTESSGIKPLLEKVNIFLAKLDRYVGDINNKRIRLYATGIFQKLSASDRNTMTIQIFVNYGLYFNIIPPDLEKFYLEKSMSLGISPNIMDGIIHQEFRKVVVCGSFQQHLQDIGDVITVLHERDVTVLSPWTTKVIPETLGTDFILLEGQEPLKNKRDAWRHKYEHMDKFRQSDAIIVCNPDGLIGQGTIFEFGFMVALSKRIIFTEIPIDFSIPFPYEIGLNF